MKIQPSSFISDISLAHDHLFIGDNIYLLNALKEQGKKIDVIYIDPPYNTKKNIYKYNDNRKTDEWVAFMKERLVVAYDVLAEDGVILVSIDDNHYAHLKIMLDDIFGIKNFVANFIWRKSHTVKNDKTGISTQQEYILCFAKNAKRMYFNREPIEGDYIKRAYRHEDERGRYRVVPLQKEKNKNHYAITAPNGKVWTKGWNYNLEGFKKLLQDDLVYWGKNGNNCPTKKVYLRETMDKSFGSMLPTTVGYTGHGKRDLEALGFSKTAFLYAKPVSLIKHLLGIFTHEKSVVLDFFAGSGTTAQAVIEQNILDKGQRRFLMGTNNEEGIADTITIPRIERIFQKRKIDTKQFQVTQLDD